MGQFNEVNIFLISSSSHDIIWDMETRDEGMVTFLHECLHENLKLNTCVIIS